MLEDRKIHPSVFMEIQEAALNDVRGAQESIETACKFLSKNNLSKGFSMRYILEQLEKLGFDFQKRPEIARIDDDPADASNTNDWVLNNKFILSTLKFAEFQVLRDIKHRARIPIEDSHVLVGIADEGQEYRLRGIKKIGEQKIEILTEGNVFGMSPGCTSKRT